MTEPLVLPKGAAALIARAAAPGFGAWHRSIVRLGGCTNPIHLVGGSTLVDTRTGEALHAYVPQEHGGRLLTVCGNRRATVCPTCARVYRADTYQLIRAGLVGGKQVPEAVDGHPRVFATFTAPGFGPVHTRRERNGRVRACRPRRTGEKCPHGLPSGCPARHREDDPALGEPLCPRCYDYAGAVLWQAHAGTLWHRFALELRRELARRAGLPRTALGEVLRLSYAKVAEYQRRGLIHFHAVIRLDGPDGPDTTPPGWATTGLLTDAVRTAVGLVHLVAPGREIVGPRVLRFGPQVDVRPISALGAGERLTSAAVAGYIAKYATKGAEAAGAVDARIRRSADLATLPVRDHTLRMIGTCWWLGGLEPFEPLGLRRWAHMLGYGGHFSSKSRRYSTTLTALRQARAEYRAEKQRAALGLDDRPVISVGQWRYAGRGYSPEGTLVAASVREGGGGHGA
ncbi:MULTISPECIES: replication initiator [Streptomyces]|uniref:Replication initiation protein n=2 Tax=Streptomyces TaxID=1883 RepID=A0A3R7I577_9ACTN|nr:MULTISPECIES: replication initiator [Streptomyces]KNE83502.1 replication initiation protein [Streptomyces fradiae]OFA61988.1 replication initiation protein [Streptomyces fradiae]PQM24313.1 replication initiation protein [Streptomyces xinghaiensis]RKM97281.1 replication initiation protein [Streptomyces xinghaiensis]RNC75323.1 replication initiation protein [Streptomyces xinghaiensis]